MERHARRQRAARRQWAPRRQRAARRRRPPWPLSQPSAPSAPRGPPCCPRPGLAAAPAAWRAAAWGRARDRPATVRGRPQVGRRPCDLATHGLKFGEERREASDSTVAGRTPSRCTADGRMVVHDTSQPGHRLPGGDGGGGV
eukprot:scaffold810_cov49-Phaeocystis_antarctica.AAC.2